MDVYVRISSISLPLCKHDDRWYYRTRLLAARIIIPFVIICERGLLLSLLFTVLDKNSTFVLIVYILETGGRCVITRTSTRELRDGSNLRYFVFIQKSEDKHKRRRLYLLSLKGERNELILWSIYKKNFIFVFTSWHHFVIMVKFYHVNQNNIVLL